MQVYWCFPKFDLFYFVISYLKGPRGPGAANIILD